MTINEYINLSKLAQTKFSREPERKTSMRHVWSAFGKQVIKLRGYLPLCLKGFIFYLCVLEVMTYESETMTLTKSTKRKSKCV